MTSIKNYVSLINKYDRVITLIDMDCFYCQVEEKLDKSLAGKPIAVVQYNEWKGGGIIAVNYVARAKGVSRHMRGDEAKEHCPDIQLIKVPVVRGKADLTKFREAGKEVAAVLQNFTPLLERASIDEAYLDITERVNARLKEMNEGRYKLDATKFMSTYAVGYENIGDFVHDITSRVVDANTINFSQSVDDESEHELAARKKSDLKLLIGASIVSEIRAAVKEKTGYDCSAGIAHNKIMAKLTAGMNKPNKQTLLPLRSIPTFFNTLPVSKVKGLGGKFGEEVCKMFKVKNIGELVAVPREELIKQFDEKNGGWLYLVSRGIDLECVTPRYTTKSIGCCKRFPGANAITGIASLNHWLGELASEICERLEKDQLENNRTAKQMTISYSQTFGKEDVSSSRSVALNYYEPEQIAKEALDVLKRNIQPFFRQGGEGILVNPIKFLGISVGKFEDNIDTSRKTKLQKLFENQKGKERNSKRETEIPKPVLVKASASDPLTSFNSNKPATLPTTLEEIMSRKVGPTVDVDEPKPDKPKSNLLSIFEAIKRSKLATSTAVEAKEKSPPKNTEPSGSFLKNFFVKKQLLEGKNIIEQPSSSKEDLLSSPDPVPFSNTEIYSPIPEKVEDDLISDEDEENIAPVKPLNSVGEPSMLGITATSTQKPAETVESDLIELEVLICGNSNDSEPREPDPISPQPSTSTKPVIFFEPIYITCDICNKKVFEDDILSHKDFHFAKEICQQERESFRKSISDKINRSSIFQSKSAKAKQQKPGEKTLRPLAAFLKKLEEQQAAKNSDGIETFRCDKCFKNIKITEKVEHADYHVAKRLQSEMNRIPVQTEATVHQPPAKRKRIPSGGEKGKIYSQANVVPLTRFFEKN